MLNFKGCGLPNVYLADGHHEVVFDGGKAYSYSDIAGLYHEIARSVATAACPMTGDEFRFLRKRLNWSQSEAGAVLDKTAQAVAKWEKGETPVPRSDAAMLRLAWLNTFSPEDTRPVVAHMLADWHNEPVLEYILMFTGGRWARTERHWSTAAAELSAQAIADAQRASREEYSAADPVVEVRQSEGGSIE